LKMNTVRKRPKYSSKKLKDATITVEGMTPRSKMSTGKYP